MKISHFTEEHDQSALRFYEDMAQRADTAGVRSIFKKLAGDERNILKHHRRLTATAEDVDIESLDDATNVYDRLRGCEEQIVIHDDVEAYRLALEAEREVVHQYRCAIKTEQHPQARKMLMEISHDDQRLMTELESLYDFANAPNHYLAWGEFSNLGEFHNFGRDMV